MAPAISILAGCPNIAPNIGLILYSCRTPKKLLERNPNTQGYNVKRIWGFPKKLHPNLWTPSIQAVITGPPTKKDSQIIETAISDKAYEARFGSAPGAAASWALLGREQLLFRSS